MMELLAPAGGPEQLRIATHFGADAVYLAGKRWGMRARSENFSDEELERAVTWAYARGVAVHVTLNVVMDDVDMDEVVPFIEFIGHLGVDAAIVADLGVLQALKTHAPNVEAHLSTQVSVMSAATADAWASLGVRRIVLAREMSLKQIAELRRRCTRELELEVFAHGSMCMAVSGRCLLSAELMGRGRSASRGACAQPCRWGWSLVEDRTPDMPLPVETDERGSYLLSSNDLCMIEHLGELEEAGVDAIKIEGRAKGSYYTACVTNAYRHVLDGDPAGRWRRELDEVSHRPYSTGFFFGEAAQNPGRVEYQRERVMVAIACSSEGEYGSFLVEMECRNRAERNAQADVLSPGEDVRVVLLRGLEELDVATGEWVPVDVMAHNMGRYRFRSKIPLSKRDLICVRSEG